MPEITRVLVVGSTSLDILLHMDDIPEAGESAAGQGYRYAAGGCGTIAALMFARLGLDPVLCSRTARDANGMRLNDLFLRNGIDSRFVTMEPRGFTGLCAVISTSADANRTVVYEGANRLLSEDDIEAAMTCCPDAVFLQLSVPERAALAASEFASRRGVPVYIYTGTTASDFPLSKLDKTEVFITDEKGVTLYTGHTVFRQSTFVQICMALASAVEAKYYVVKLRNGNTIVSNNMILRVYTPPCETIETDPATALDAFAATLTAEYLRCRNMERAVRLAGIVEAMTRSGEGASRSLPRTAQDIQKFVNDNGIDFKV